MLLFIASEQDARRAVEQLQQKLQRLHSHTVALETERLQAAQQAQVIAQASDDARSQLNAVIAERDQLAAKLSQEVRVIPPPQEKHVVLADGVV